MKEKDWKDILILSEAKRCRKMYTNHYYLLELKALLFRKLPYFTTDLFLTDINFHINVQYCSP